MATPQARFDAPPSIAIAADATTPDPGRVGVTVWSSTLGRRVQWDGTRWRMLPTIHIGTAAPSSPQVGDMWLDMN